MKVLILGSNPSAMAPRKESTLTRIERWAERLGIKYDFANVIEHHVKKESVDDVSFIRILRLTMQYDKILTLGKFPDSVLTKMKIQHYALPHPSPPQPAVQRSDFRGENITKIVGFRISFLI